MIKFGVIFPGCAAGILFCACLAAHAAFDDLGAGARAAGMGNAFAALADDAFGFYYNPAGLGHVRQGQLASEYGKLWVGLSDRSDLSRSFVAAAVPVFSSKRVEVAAVSASTAAAQSVESSTGSKKTEFKTVTTHVGTICAAWQSFSLQGYYQESAYYVGFGRSRGKKRRVKLQFRCGTAIQYLATFFHRRFGQRFESAGHGFKFRRSHSRHGKGGAWLAAERHKVGR